MNILLSTPLVVSGKSPRSLNVGKLRPKRASAVFIGRWGFKSIDLVSLWQMFSIFKAPDLRKTHLNPTFWSKNMTPDKCCNVGPDGGEVVVSVDLRFCWMNPSVVCLLWACFFFLTPPHRLHPTSSSPSSLHFLSFPPPPSSTRQCWFQPQRADGHRPPHPHAHRGQGSRR